MKPGVFEITGNSCQVIPERTLAGAQMGSVLKSMTRLGITCRFSVGGTSMFPFIIDGDTVSVSPLKNRLPEIGDVVAFLTKGSEDLILHRIIGVQKDGCVVKGDARLQPDGIISNDRILGRVIRVERNGRSLRLGLGYEKVLVALCSASKPFMKVVCLLAKKVKNLSGRSV